MELGEVLGNVSFKVEVAVKKYRAGTVVIFSSYRFVKFSKYAIYYAGWI